MEEFYTRETSNKGNKLPLYTPDGEKSKHWFIVRGTDSDAFKIAELTAKRKLVEIAQIKDDEERSAALLKSQTTVIASLISEWSFDKPCTEENKIEFLRNAPQVAEAINRYAGNRSNFFKKRSQDSESGTAES